MRDTRIKNEGMMDEREGDLRFAALQIRELNLKAEASFMVEVLTEAKRAQRQQIRGSPLGAPCKEI